MMRLSFVSTLIPLLLFLSCTVSVEERSYIDHINRLEKVLDSTSNLYFAIDTIELFAAYDHINDNLSELNKLDPIINDSVRIYAALQKSFKRFISEHSLILDEIEYSGNQLQTLKKDIQKGRVSEEQMKNYFLEEKEAVGILIQKISFNTQNITQQLNSFSQLNDSVEAIIEQLENR